MPITLRVNGAEHQVEAAPDENCFPSARCWVLPEPNTVAGDSAALARYWSMGRRPGPAGPVTAAVGKQITTIEGLEKNGRLHPVQEAFLKAEAFQCGYCTSGAIISAVALLNKTPNPTDQQIMASLEGNVCRCGTYPRILDAIREAGAAQRR